jgi:hypothetical protein
MSVAAPCGIHQRQLPVVDWVFISALSSNSRKSCIVIIAVFVALENVARMNVRQLFLMF